MFRIKVEAMAPDQQVMRDNMLADMKKHPKGKRFTQMSSQLTAFIHVFMPELEIVKSGPSLLVRTKKKMRGKGRKFRA